MKKLLVILGVLAAVCAVINFQNPRFHDPGNLTNLSLRIAFLALFSLGEALVIIAGGIDLSIGSMICFSAITFGGLVTWQEWPFAAAAAAALGVSLLVGLIHGLLITRLRLPAFIVTLGGLLILRSLCRFFTDDNSVSLGSRYPWFRSLSEAPSGGGIAPIVWIVLGITAVMAVVVHKLRFGRYCFAIGGNVEAARLAGIPTDRIRVVTYMVSSGLAGLAGILYTSYLPSVQPSSVGVAAELYAVAAAVLGGCSLAGGVGMIPGVVIGASLMLVLQNGITLMEISDKLEMTVVGVVILLASVADAFFQRKRA